jgi:preprotein translocase subunit YajC
VNLAVQNAGGGGAGITPLLLIVLLFVVMYFLMIRPQQKRRREAVQLQSNLAPGDHIVTIGGLHGIVAAVEDDLVDVEISPGVEVRFARPAIARVVVDPSPDDEAVVPADDEPAEDEPVAVEPVVEEPVVSPVVETRKKD